MNTILYTTDNTLDPAIMALCQRILLREAGELPIVSVSQKPLELGRNVCVGEIGRSWYSLYTQLLAGLAAIDTDWVVMAEHDCLYTAEHLHYQPKNPDVFHYNSNCWLVQWGGNHPELDGMYSYWPHRVALSQLICRRSLLEQATRDVVCLLDMGLRVEQGLRWHGEPGVVSETFRKAYLEATSGRPIQLQDRLQQYVQGYASGHFATEQPNLDIRHASNFSGPRRGKKRCYELAPWGRFADLMEVTSGNYHYECRYQSPSVLTSG